MIVRHQQTQIYVSMTLQLLCECFWVLHHQFFDLVVVWRGSRVFSKTWN